LEDTVSDEWKLKRVYKKKGMTDLFKSEGRSLIVDLAEKKTKKAVKKLLR